jgi:predicted metal-dependent hydrolase
MTSPRALPAEYRRFVHEFNHGWYWASHETLEDVWRRTRSEYYHGLILLASVFVHVQRENPHGVAAQLDKAITALSSYRPQYLGMDVTQLIRHLHKVQSAVRRESTRPDGGARGITAPALELEERLILGTEPELDPE